MPFARVVTCTSEVLGLYATAAGVSGNSSARLLMACGFIIKKHGDGGTFWA
jgi:hypothetical protein